jgi:hypothetical protein
LLIKGRAVTVRAVLDRVRLIRAARRASALAR